MDRYRQEGLRKAIRKHLTDYGARNWKLVREKFTDIPHATFWRVVKAVREEKNDESKASNTSTPDLAAPRPILFPDYCEPVQKLAEYESVIRSAQELIDQAKGPGGKIKNWQMHAKGVALRESLVRNQVEVMGQLHALGKDACLYQAVVDLVTELTPDRQKSFMHRLHELAKLSGDELLAATKDARSNPAKLGR